MAYATSRIGAGGTFLREHDVEPSSRPSMPSQDRTPVYLPAQARSPRTPAGRP
jgi:hypothetical protein